MPDDDANQCVEATMPKLPRNSGLVVNKSVLSVVSDDPS
jgi:hypothetical protein